MNIYKAKSLIRYHLLHFGLTHRLTARTVSFQDLARDEMIFVTIHNWIPDPRAKVLEALARKGGFRVTFRS